MKSTLLAFFVAKAVTSEPAHDKSKLVPQAKHEPLYLKGVVYSLVSQEAFKAMSPPPP